MNINDIEFDNEITSLDIRTQSLAEVPPREKLTTKKKHHKQRTELEEIAENSGKPKKKGAVYNSRLSKPQYTDKQQKIDRNNNFTDFQIKESKLKKPTNVGRTGK